MIGGTAVDYAKEILQKAGVKTTHQNYKKKLDQLYSLRLAESDLELVYKLDAQILRYLYIGTLTINNREAFIKGMASNMSQSIRALTLIDVKTLVSVLNKIEVRLGADGDSRSSEKWHELGLELAVGIDEDPLVLLRRYWDE